MDFAGIARGFQGRVIIVITLSRMSGAVKIVITEKETGADAYLSFLLRRLCLAVTATSTVDASDKESITKSLNPISYSYL